jgi:serine/threonine protein kinase
MGEVYRARDPRLARDVAVKVIRSESALDADRRRRFEDEARAVGALNHPNVLSVFDVGTENGQPYVVFELLEGESLAARLQRGPLSVGAALDYGVQACQGLAAAHAKGIVHRDLKPSNLFLTSGGHLKILDFGLAKLAREAGLGSAAPTRTRTYPGVIVGTLAYLSPEQARGQAADARSDLFALGATLYEMLSGRPAFLRATPAETVSAILTDEPAAIAAPREPLPLGLEAVVKRCLEKDPDQRFQSARDLGFALRAFAAPSPSEGRPGGERRGRGRILLVGSFALAAALAAAYFLGPSTKPKTVRSMSVVPFTTYSGSEFSPTFSPDGSQIAFSWTGEAADEKGVDLYTKVVGSEKALRLTTHHADAILPAWSPDGRTIAYARLSREGSGIYSIPALGGPERRLVEVPFDFPQELSLSWSPDGKLLAFTDAPPELPWGVSILDVATLQKRRLDPPAPNCQWSWMPAFSPDGLSLARVCLVSMDVNDIYVGPVQGGPLRRVAHVNGGFDSFAWTGDGASLVVSAGGNLARYPVGGGDPKPLLFGRDALTPAVSRDGRRLAYVQQVLRANLYRVPLGTSPATAASPVPLVPSSRYDYCPAFSADGRRLAFQSNRSGSPEIWVSDADGSSLHPVTSFGGPSTGSPRWSPDGRWIALDSKAAGQSDIYVVDPEGGVPVRVETGEADPESPFWSSDGTTLYFTALVKRERQVFKVPRTGGRSTQLTSQGGEVPRAAPDGRRVYYFRFAGKTAPSLWSVSAEGGDERPVVGVGSVVGQSYAAWEVGPRGVHYLDRGERPALFFLDFATGRSRRVADLPKNLSESWCTIALAPDGKSLVVPLGEPSASDIMLVDDFE